ncbi:MAG: hypothetical protein LBU14_04335 [Candidatus Peribacteria bacterium]|nr:hypothetical protein [Candidatus Peribacteria bacterium]
MFIRLLYKVLLKTITGNDLPNTHKIFGEYFNSSFIAVSVEIFDSVKWIAFVCIHLILNDFNLFVHFFIRSDFQVCIRFQCSTFAFMTLSTSSNKTENLLN